MKTLITILALISFPILLLIVLNEERKQLKYQNKMKKQLLILALIGLSSSAMAQKLPSKVTVVFTDKQLLRIDSAINAGNAIIDSKRESIWYIKSFEPLYEQVRKQMIVDTAKKPLKK